MDLIMYFTLYKFKDNIFMQAEMAGKISVKQFELALRLGDRSPFGCSL